MYVSNVDLDVAHVAMAIHACFKCFIYFRRMLQFECFKSRSSIAHVVAIHTYFKSILQVFYLFQTYVASVLF
jgi:hypothetical protein